MRLFYVYLNDWRLERRRFEYWTRYWIGPFVYLWVPRHV